MCHPYRGGEGAGNGGCGSVSFVSRFVSVGQAGSSDGEAGVAIADGVARVTVKTATVNTASGILAETIDTRRRYQRSGCAVGQAPKDR